MDHIDAPLPAISAMPCFEIEELTRDLFSCFPRKELFRFKDWEIYLFKSKLLTHRRKVREQPVPLSHLVREEITCP